VVPLAYPLVTALQKQHRAAPLVY